MRRKEVAKRLPWVAALAYGEYETGHFAGFVSFGPFANAALRNPPISLSQG
jgi:hypothetical protein